MLFGNAIRREGRGNASFALVAVGLLIAGGAAAVYLHAVDGPSARSLGASSLEQQALRREAEQEEDVLNGIARTLLDEQVGAGFTAGDGALSRASARFAIGLAARLGEIYPRINSQGHLVCVNLSFARVMRETDGSVLASPLGGLATVELPVFVAAEAGAEVSVESADGGNATVFAVFGGRASLPILLPFSLASRVATEASYGGRVERIVGQALNSTLRTLSATPFTPARVDELVRFGVEAELALEFGASGNATLDARLAALKASAGKFDVSDFYGPKAYFHETYPLDGILRPIAFGGAPTGAALTPSNVSTASLATNLSWVIFDSQELAGGDRGAATLSVSGTLSFEVRLQTGNSSLRIGPFGVPIAFQARAYGIGLPGNLSVPPAELRAALDDLESRGSGSLYAFPAVLGEYLAVSTKYNFSDASRNGTIVQRVVDFLAQTRRPLLPPVENGALFSEMFGPSSWSVTRGRVALAGPFEINGSRAVLSLDGLAVASARVTGGGIEIPRFPQGRHLLAVQVGAAEGVLSGSLVAVFGAASFNVTVELLPVATSAFLQGAFARASSEGRNASAGAAGLAEAAAVAGLPIPTGFETQDEAEAFARRALARLDVMLASHALTRATRDRAEDARVFAKIAVLVLDAIDELKALEGDGAITLADAGRAGAQLALNPDAAAALTLSYAGYKVAGAALTENGIVVKVYGESHAVASLRVGMNRFGLVMEALVGAATIAADFVEIHDRLDENDAGGAAIASVKLGVDLAKLTLAFAKLEYRMAGKVAAKAAEKAMVRATLVTAAVALIVDLAVLYHEHNGNWSEMGEALVHPGSADGVLDLPFLAMGAVEFAAAAYLITMGATAAEIGAVAGPLGVAAALFVLAALLVLNKETVACAIYGTICLSSLGAIRRETGKAVSAMFNASAYANGFDLGRLALAARVASAGAASKWLSQALDPSTETRSGDLELPLRQRAERLSALERAARALRHASAAAVEQLDDLASGPLVSAEGRSSEGYGEHCTLVAGCIHFAGNVSVSKSVGSSWDAFGRWRWRPLLANVTTSELGEYSFAFTLTETNAIDLKEYERWSKKANTAVQRVSDAFEEIVRGQRALALSP